MAAKRNEGICSIDGCGADNQIKGLCRRHYYAQKAREFRAEHPGYDKRRPPERRARIHKQCSIEGCGEPITAKGLCHKHYMRKRQSGRTDLVNTGTKRSHPFYAMWFQRKNSGILCEEWHNFSSFIEGVGEKPGSNYALVRLRGEEPYGPANFEWREHLVKKPDETKKEWNARKWISRREHFPDYESDRYLKRKYGITSDDYERMFREQDGKCAICHRTETAFNHQNGRIKRLSVDHCHTTGMVRQLLCYNCNSGLAFFQDSIEVLRSALNYMIKNNEKNAELIMKMKAYFDQT